MPNIYYYKSPDGSFETGRWVSKSVRSGSVVKKEKQIYLGKVIDKDRLIFYKREEGFYIFNPETQEASIVSKEEMALLPPPPDRRLKERNVIVTFGGSFFLQTLIESIGYDSVLSAIQVKNRDTLYALLHYYVLMDGPDCDAEKWYQNSYARFMFPSACMASQRISEFYVTFGSDNNRKAFFKKHIEYLLNVTDDEFIILIDSTGCQNRCKIPFTRISRHNNEVNEEYRVVIIVHRSTGHPVYYEVIPGNVIDANTILRILRLMRLYGLKITLVSGDAGYSCPSNIEKIVLCGLNLIMRLNPAYNLYKKALEEHTNELMDPAFHKETDVRYRDRLVRVIRIPMVIGTDVETKEEKQGYVYLCRDMQAYHSKCDHYMEHHVDKNASAEEVFDACSKFGVFALVTSIEFAVDDVLALYYLRQGVEQYIDIVKNYGKMMPVRNHNIHTINGHMLFSFITSFLVVAIKNKMNIMDLPFVAVPLSLAKDEDTVLVESGDKQELITSQDVNEIVYASDPGALFLSLNLVGADVFDDQPDNNNQLVPAIPMKEANDYFKVFGIPCPEAVLIQEDHSLNPVYKNKQRITCSKSKVFSVRPYASEEEIRKQRENAHTPQAEKSAPKQEITPDLDTEKEKQQDQASVLEQKAKKKGRRPGSKNKATLKREAEMVAHGEYPPVKRPRGRPRGSKNKKTLQREAEMAARGEWPPVKRPRGRPLGSKNKRTLEREAQTASEK